MLNRVQSKLGSRASDFSVVSTMPAGSPTGPSAENSSMLEFPLSSTQNFPEGQGKTQSNDELTTTTCTGDSLELSLESAFSPPVRTLSVLPRSIDRDLESNSSQINRNSS